jgi:hypothetical protein
MNFYHSSLLRFRMIKKTSILLVFFIFFNLISLYYFIVIKNQLAIILLFFSILVIIMKYLNIGQNIVNKIDYVLLSIFRIITFILVSIVFFIFFVPLNFILRNYVRKQFNFDSKFKSGYTYDQCQFRKTY